MNQVSFWHQQHMRQFAEHIAIYDAQSGEQVTYAQLDELVQNVANYLEGSCNSSTKKLIAIEASQHPLTVVVYLAALRAGHCAWLLNPELAEPLQKELLAAFQVNEWIKPSLTTAESALKPLSPTLLDKVTTTLSSNAFPIHKNLALLLSTSGSTGSGQLVRLSYENLNANCESINLALPIKQTDRAMLNLPLHYSFGLSILNTHLAKGAAIVLSSHSVIAREFWQDWKTFVCTSLYGVPYSFEMLNRLRLSRLPLEDVRYLAHAGGPLNQADWQALKTWSEETGKPVYSMYGQTEATARIALLDPERFLTKFPAIGSAIPHGELRVVDELGNNVAQGEAGELIYRGANVMMGMANSVQDLAFAAGDATLATGDIAYQDKDGDFVIVGRKKRFIKITGHRISLDATEQWLKAQQVDGQVLTQVACAGADDSLQCCIADKLNDEQQQALRKMIASFLRVHPRYCQIVCVEAIPRTASGKVNYAALKDVA